jgi:hypothetical protein
LCVCVPACLQVLIVEEIATQEADMWLHALAQA